MGVRRSHHRALAAAAAGATVAIGLAVTPAPAPAAAPAPGYGRQRLSWGGCAGVDTPGLRCADVRVPLDHDHPRGRSITIVISRLPATDPALRRGVLVTTGGGPGGPGVPIPGELARTLDPAVLARYDLIGFDLRFLERSTPIGCGQPAEEPGGWWSHFAAYLPLAATADQAARYAADCARHAGWALPHATTANVARDMDVVRAALGERKISYLGGSYAATLGAVYASMFPARVDRFVLDSPPDYTTLWHRFDLDRTAAMEENLDAFADWLAADDATYHLGTTRAAVRDRITDLLGRASRSEVTVDGRTWTVDEVSSLVIVPVFFEQYRSYYAPGVAALAAGTPPPYDYELRPRPGVPGVPVDNRTALGTAFRCADGPWPRALDSYRRDLAAYTARYPLFGSLNANVVPCAFWPAPTGAGRAPFGTRSAPGTLVVAALHDADVPLANPVAVRDALAGSRLVTVDQRNHVPFLGGTANACLTAAVTGMLAEGRLPAADLAC